jgi:hypothetical protein
MPAEVCYIEERCIRYTCERPLATCDRFELDKSATIAGDVEPIRHVINVNSVRAH